MKINAVRQIIIPVIFILVIALTVMTDFAAADNGIPSISVAARQYIIEGETLSFSVRASDPDGDPVSINLSSHPVGASLTDNGDGSSEFVWTPDFTGRNSSDGSPFTIQFTASDGVNTNSAVTEVVVINKNRCPSISAPDTIEVPAGDLLEFSASGYDPDNDEVDWKLENHPIGMNIARTNPADIGWQTNYADSGIYNISLNLIDEYGAADTSNVVLNVLQTTVYELSIDTISTYSGEYVSVGVNLMNLEPVNGIDVVVNYDVSVLTFMSLTSLDTRAENWEYFGYSMNYRSISGDIHIYGTADLDNGVESPVIEPGDGEIASISFLVSGDLSYAGQNVPLKLVFRDELTNDDNTLTDTAGEKITQEMISYVDGFIHILGTSEDGIGDVNLNGVTYEIGDVIYLTNYFVNPIMYPLSPQQSLNSDVNRDGYGGTIADLVFMINKILSLNYSGKVAPYEGKVQISVDEESSRGVAYNSEIALGGAVFVLGMDNYGGISLSPELKAAGMEMQSTFDGEKLRVAIYSEEGNRIPSGTNTLFELEGNSEFTIDEIQLSTADGFRVGSLLKNGNGLLPGTFKLYQNVPNPFNPVTEIKFDLPKAGFVSLTVFNLLGQEVVRLIETDLPAGSHSITWNGRDESGRGVSSGIYFYRLDGAGFSDKKKMILLK